MIRISRWPLVEEQCLAKVLMPLDFLGPVLIDGVGRHQVIRCALEGEGRSRVLRRIVSIADQDKVARLGLVGPMAEAYWPIVLQDVRRLGVLIQNRLPEAVTLRVGSILGDPGTESLGYFQAVCHGFLLDVRRRSHPELVPRLGYSELTSDDDDPQNDD